MEYEFIVYQMRVGNHEFWVAESKCLKGCVGQGETTEAAIQELAINEQEWLLTAQEVGIPIPAKTFRSEKSYSGKIALRVSPFVHEDAVDVAKEQGISLNQFINDALISYIGAVKAKSVEKKYWQMEQNAGLRVVSPESIKIVNDEEREEQ